MSRRVPSARKVAIRTLRQVEQRRGFSNRILSEQLEKHPELSRPDRGLVTTLVYGVLREQSRLDHHIDAVARKPSGIKGELRVLLRVATYELTTLQKPAAVVGAEATKSARAFDRDGRLARLVTAIVANIDRRGPELAAQLAQAAPLDQLAVRWSLPAWLAARWLEQLGPDRALARAAALLEVPPLDLRVDLSRIERAVAARRLLEDHPGIELEAPDEHPATLRARGGGDLFFGPLHEAGLVSVQALGSQRAVQVLAPRPGERVWDACAGQGIKTLQIAELMGRRGSITATDPSTNRLAALRDTAMRGELWDHEALVLEVGLHTLGAEPIANAAASLPPNGTYDAILVDAPCTGLGNLARHPELRWTTRPEDIEACAGLQRRILRDASTALAPRGRLVYAVCSLEPEEGAALVAAVADDLGLRVEHEESWTPESDGTDGFFLASLRRADDDSSAVVDPRHEHR